MEAFSALLTLCVGNSPGKFPSQRPVTRSFDVFFDLCLNKRLSKQSWGWWFETPPHPLRRHNNEFLVAKQQLLNRWSPSPQTHFGENRPFRVNSSVVGICGINFRSVISEHLLRIKFKNTTWAIALTRMQYNTFVDKSILLQVIAWCRHYLSQYWPKSMSPYAVEVVAVSYMDTGLKNESKCSSRS